MHSFRSKNVRNQFMNDLPELEENECVARILQTQGSDLFDVEIAVDDEHFQITLVRLPSRFKNTLWVKAGSLVILFQPDVLTSAKVTHEIKHILSHDQVKHLLKMKMLPLCFVDDGLKKYLESSVTDVEVSSRFLSNTFDSDEDALPANPNHKRRPFEDSESDEDEED